MEQQVAVLLTKSEEAALFQDEYVQNAMNAVLDPNFSFDVDNYGLQAQRIIPPNNSSVLCTKEFEGIYNFQIAVPYQAPKSPYEYSSILNKIYINMLDPLPVEFSIANRPPQSTFFIRATPTFSLPQHSQEYVLRCINHEYEPDPSNLNIERHVRWHVIRCDKESTSYNLKESNERLNILLPLDEPQTGSNAIRELFRFACKTSCVNGMNRRPIIVTFTLEDETGAILGRQNLNVRICSCPKRDKDKEEIDHRRKNDPTYSKKRKMLPYEKPLPLNSNTDTKEYMLHIPIVGKENYNAVLRFSRDRMSGESLSANENNENCPFKKCVNQINCLISTYFDDSNFSYSEPGCSQSTTK